jgi:hypothetical protein
LVLRGRKKEDTGDNYMKRSFIVCGPHQMLPKVKAIPLQALRIPGC